MSGKTGAPTPKTAALAALKRAQEEAARTDGVNLTVLGYLLEDASRKLEAVTEGRPGRRKKRDAIPAEEIPH